MQKVDEPLLRAYQDARYRVEDATEFRVGECCADLAALHAEHGARHSHFITAFNPESRRLSADENVARHAALGERIDVLGARRLAAAGLDPGGQWPPEPGYLVFDLADDVALALGRDFDQNAIVRIGADAVPRLVVIAELG